RLDPGEWAVEDGEFVTERTHTRFDGAVDWAARGRFAFQMTSADYQEADQLLAGITTDFGSPTGTVAFLGPGTFDRPNTGPVSRPRVEGTFRGEDVRAWDTLWGDGSAKVAIENDYIDVRDGLVRLAGSEIHTDGKFSLGYRDDAEDEIDARFRIVKRDLVG